MDPSPTLLFAFFGGYGAVAFDRDRIQGVVHGVEPVVFIAFDRALGEPDADRHVQSSSEGDDAAIRACRRRVVACLCDDSRRLVQLCCAQGVVVPVVPKAPITHGAAFCVSPASASVSATPSVALGSSGRALSAGSHWR